MQRSDDRDRPQRAAHDSREEGSPLPGGAYPASNLALAGETGTDKAARSADTQRYRPVHRPPMAVLHVFDDGLTSSESFRVRTTPYVIGREEGDLVLPHDRLISGRHAAIECSLVAGRPHWILRDLDSANGTFVQVKQSILEPDREIAVARRRFRFCVPEAQADDSESPEPQSDVRRTMRWSSLVQRRQPAAPPYLVEAMPDGDGPRYPLSKSEQWIGRARDCAIQLDDPTVGPRHARVFKARDGKWCIEDAGSLNGLWVRITSLALSSGAFFLLGEQIFLITFP